jgi:hypothetical protein
MLLPFLFFPLPPGKRGKRRTDNKKWVTLLWYIIIHLIKSEKYFL